LGAHNTHREVARMPYLLAAIGALTIVVLLWRAFGARTASVPTRRRQSVVAPDDDPDFLRRLDERNKSADEEDKNPPA
jgi:hypothetical protein